MRKYPTYYIPVTVYKLPYCLVAVEGPTSARYFDHCGIGTEKVIAEPSVSDLVGEGLWKAVSISKARRILRKADERRGAQ